MTTDDRFEFQLRMFEKGAEELQRQISRLDDVGFKIKASSVTVWVALIGWSLTTERATISLLGFVVVIGFWLLEGMYRAVQIRFIDRSRDMTRILNDQPLLERAFTARELPPTAIYPLAFREPNLTQLRMYARGLGSASVATLYLFLGLVNLLVWLATQAPS